MPENTKMVKQESGELMERPDYIPQDSRGTEHLTKDDIQIPRIGLAQGLSPQIQEGDPKFIPGLKMGDMFNSLTGFNFKRGPIEFTIVRADPPRGVEFFPLDAGGGVKDFDVPLNDPRMQFTTTEDGKRKKPQATKFYDYILLLIPSGEMIALSLKGTGLKVAKSLNALMKLRGAPIFTGKYVLTSALEKKDKYTYGVYRVQNAEDRWVTRDMMIYAETIFNNIKDREIIVERETVEGEIVEDDAGDVDEDGLPNKPPF